MNMLNISWKYNEYVYCDCIYPEMTGCLVHTFGGEIPHVPGATIKNPCWTALWLLSLQLQLFTTSVWRTTHHSLRIILGKNQWLPLVVLGFLTHLRNMDSDFLRGGGGRGNKMKPPICHLSF